MSGRLPSGLLVAAMLRRAGDAGGSAMVLARGDAGSGAILVVAAEPGGPESLLERGPGPAGNPVLIDSTPADDVAGYWRRRRARDPDLWVIELIVPDAQRLVADTIASN